MFLKSSVSILFFFPFSLESPTIKFSPRATVKVLGMTLSHPQQTSLSLPFPSLEISHPLVHKAVFQCPHCLKLSILPLLTSLLLHLFDLSETRVSQLTINKILNLFPICSLSISFNLLIFVILDKIVLCSTALLKIKSSQVLVLWASTTMPSSGL